MVLWFLVACAPSEPASGDSAPLDTAAPLSTAPGALALAFQLDADLVPQMSEPPTGAVLGAIYAEADATAMGPVADAVPLFEFVTDPLDLGEASGTPTVLTTPPLDPQAVWILACLDGDANGCDCADPVTLPNDNKVRVVGEAETPTVVKLDLLHPC